MLDTRVAMVLDSMQQSAEKVEKFRMNRSYRCFTTILLLLTYVIALTVMSPIVYAERVKLALPSRSMGYLPLFVALHRGFMKDEGIDLELPMLLPNIAHNALLSGEVDYHGVADSALRLAAKGAPLKSI